MSNLEKLGWAIDAQSHEWLAVHLNDVLTGVEDALKQGEAPHEIKRFVLIQTGRIELALRCEQAARHIKRIDN